MFVGTYEWAGTTTKNNWHYVTITYNVASNTYMWKNRAGVSWTLYPKSSSELRVGTDCPYYKNGHKVARFTSTGVYGPWDEFYKRSAVPTTGLPSTTQPPTTAPPSTTQPPTTGPPSTTQPPTTGSPTTTQPPTTGPPSTTQPPTTGPSNTTQPPTTGSPTTTQPPTTGPPSTTQPPTTGPSNTTQPPTTGPPSTTQPPTTGPSNTTQPPTTGPSNTTQPPTPWTSWSSSPQPPTPWTGWSSSPQPPTPWTGWSSSPSPPTPWTGWSSSPQPPTPWTGWTSTNTPSPGPTTTLPPGVKKLTNFTVTFKNGDMGGMKVVTPYPTTGVTNPDPTMINPATWQAVNHVFCGSLTGSDNSTNGTINHHPIQDRAWERGYFIAVHGSKPTDTGKASILESGRLAGDYGQAMEFYYYMWNSNVKLGHFHQQMGSLEVSVMEEGSDGKSCVKWSKTSAINGAWNHAMVYLDVKPGKFFRLKFTAILGNSKSTIAIDDIKGVAMFPTQITMHATASRPIYPPSILACSFSSKVDPTCKWSNRGTFKWQVINGTTPSYETGPDRAVTERREDKYVYAEASDPQKPGSIASLASPEIYTDKPTCMMFYMNTYGINVGELRIEASITNNTRGGRIVRHGRDITDRSLSKNWKLIGFQLPVGVRFKVQLKATIGNGYHGDMAIDNIFTVPGMCQMPAMGFRRQICDFDDMAKCKQNGVYGMNFKVAKEIDTSAGMTGCVSTTGGNANGTCCSFPFTYKNKVYNTCTNLNHNQLWCATTKDYNKDKKWGNCNIATNNYYKASGQFGWADLSVTLKNVSRSGGCFGMLFRVQATRGRAHVYLNMFGDNGDHMLSKDLKPAAEGKMWQFYQETIPPRQTNGDVRVDFHASFGNGRFDLKELDVDGIYLEEGLCSKWAGTSSPKKKKIMTDKPSSFY